MSEPTDCTTESPAPWLLGPDDLAAVAADDELCDALARGEAPNPFDPIARRFAAFVAEDQYGGAVKRIDLDDTSRCRLGYRCESCGAEHSELTVSTAWTPLGVVCLTMCPRCAGSGMAPPVAVGTGVRLVCQHAEHLGIDVDQMAVILERREER